MSEKQTETYIRTIQQSRDWTEHSIKTHGFSGYNKENSYAGGTSAPAAEGVPEVAGSMEGSVLAWCRCVVGHRELSTWVGQELSLCFSVLLFDFLFFP